MTTHGRGTFARAWLGSVADGLVRHAIMPVLLVRPGEQPPGAGVEHVFHHVLVPVDQSEVAEEVLACAVALGEPGVTRFTLLRVVPPTLLSGHELATHGAHADPADLEEARSLAELNTIAGVMRARGIPIEAQVVRHPQPARGILEYAGDHGIDAIAMATRGREGLSRLLLGSVTDKVLRGTTLPILLYGPQGRPPAPSNQAA
jgi:nucleotide-binding universal stress UspA family protein